MDALVTPSSLGLIFWTTLTFLIVLFLLSRFAWRPIVNALNEREKTITDALSSAERAKSEMVKLQAQNEALLQEARLERDKILRDAKAAADRVVAEAKERATTEANKIVASAQDAIQNEKAAAMNEVKQHVASLSLTIAEKIIRKELGSQEAQVSLVKNFMNEMKLN